MSDELQRLSSRADFEAFRSQAQQRWTSIWDGDKTVVSVGLDSSSIPMGAEEVLNAFRAIGYGTELVVREVSGNGALWMEPWVELKRPGQPPIVYGNVLPTEADDILDGRLEH